MLLDLRHLARTLRRAPASVGAAILTLALTLGAGTAILAVVDAVLLTPPPFARPAALVTVGETPLDAPPATPRAVGYATFEAWRGRAGALAAVEAYDGTNLTLTGVGAAQRVRASNVTPGFLPLLGVAPALGRGLAPDDVGQPVAVISHAFWRGPLAGDRAVIGRRIVLGGQAHTIVGVLPERFAFALSASDVWRPFPVTPPRAVREGYQVRVVARLASGVPAERLGAALDETSRLSSPPSRAVVTGVGAAIAGDAPRTLGLLAGAGALAVLMAFINLAGLLLVRSIDRRRELAVRRALGASGVEIARQVLLEAEVVVAAGVAGGALLAAWLTPVVARLAVGPGAGGTAAPAVSWRAVAAMSLVAIVAAALCALVPAVAAMRRSVRDTLPRTLSAPPGERRLRRLFVAGEIALAFVLLVAVLVTGRSLASVLRVNPGFDASGAVALQVALPSARYPDPSRVAAFYTALQRAIEGRLGSGAVAVVDELPLTGDRGRGIVRAAPAATGREAVVRAASPGYFGVLRIPVVAGRGFEAGDDAAAPPRVVISASLARALYGGDAPVGRRLWLAGTARPAEVVGVAADVKHRALDETTLPTVYQSALQAPSPGSVLVVRGRGAEAGATSPLAAAVRQEVARLDAELPVYGVRPVEEIVAASPGVGTRRVLTAAFLGFAALAVLLGAMGLFGVVAHDVAARRPELALRMALGAAPARVFATTVGQGARLVAVGLLAGSVLSLWATRALAAVTFETGRGDVLRLAIAAAGVLVAAAAAAVLPTALSAARTNLLAPLKGE